MFDVASLSLLAATTDVSFAVFCWFVLVVGDREEERVLCVCVDVDVEDTESLVV